MRGRSLYYSVIYVLHEGDAESQKILSDIGDLQSDFRNLTTEIIQFGLRVEKLGTIDPSAIDQLVNSSRNFAKKLSVLLEDTKL